MALLRPSYAVLFDFHGFSLQLVVSLMLQEGEDHHLFFPFVTGLFSYMAGARLRTCLQLVSVKPLRGSSESFGTEEPSSCLSC